MTRKNANKARHAEDLMNFLDASAKETKRSICERAVQLGISIGDRPTRDIVKDIERVNSRTST